MVVTDFTKLLEIKQKIHRPVEYWPIPQRLEHSEIMWLVQEIEKLIKFVELVRDSQREQ